MFYIVFFFKIFWTKSQFHLKLKLIYDYALICLCLTLSAFRVCYIKKWISNFKENGFIIADYKHNLIICQPLTVVQLLSLHGGRLLAGMVCHDDQRRKFSFSVSSFSEPTVFWSNTEMPVVAPLCGSALRARPSAGTGGGLPVGLVEVKGLARSVNSSVKTMFTVAKFRSSQTFPSPASGQRKCENDV